MIRGRQAGHLSVMVGSCQITSQQSRLHMEKLDMRAQHGGRKVAAGNQFLGCLQLAFFGTSSISPCTPHLEEYNTCLHGAHLPPAADSLNAFFQQLPGGIEIVALIFKCPIPHEGTPRTGSSSPLWVAIASASRYRISASASSL